MERYSIVARPHHLSQNGNAGLYYMNVIIFIIRVLKLLLMNYRLALFVVLLIGIVVLPASASLAKITAGAPVFIGEVGLDISSALNGCKQIAWWDAGNDTSTPPGKILEIEGDIFRYNITPDIFSQYMGKWYSWDKKPNVMVFEVQKPEFTLRVWDLDRDRDVTGQSVPRSTRVTYRIDTNLYHAVNTLKRPEGNPLDRIFSVRFTGPNGKGITSIYTGSAGIPDTVILVFESTPSVKSSPYFWKDGGDWNHSARSGDGIPLYPLGTYTFTASQNLNNMRSYYGDTEGVTISGPKNITFVADQPTAQPTRTATTTRISTTIPPTTKPPTTTVTRGVTVITTAAPTVKLTWTSTPLPAEICFVALGMTGLCIVLLRRKAR
jgi:hypothetical protein